MSIYFTYLIGWSQHNKWYYGVRYATGCHPSDLWTKYFTSSKGVKAFRKTHGEPDIVQVRKTFTSRFKACRWEEKVLKRMKVKYREDSLNMNDRYAPPRFTGKSNPFWGKQHSEETKKKIAETKKLRKHTYKSKKLPVPPGYYVFACLNEIGTPYFIGKGSGRKFKNFKNMTPKPSQIILCEVNLTEIGAYALQRRLIRWYGRKDLGTGPLLNKTDGGASCEGFISSDEKREKHSKNSPSRRKEVAEKISKSLKSYLEKNPRK